MELAYAANMFGDTYKTLVQRLANLPRRATADDMKIIDGWEITLRDLTRQQIERKGRTDLCQIRVHSRNASSRLTIELQNKDNRDLSRSEESTINGCMRPGASKEMTT